MMKAIFKINESVTNGVTNGVTHGVTLWGNSYQDRSVTPQLWQSRNQKENDSHRHPQGQKVLQLGLIRESVTLSVTQSVTPETPINTGGKGIVLHLLHLLSYKINREISNI